MGDRLGAAVPGVASVAQRSEAGSHALFPKLKPGPGRSPEQVVANQRARLNGAMIELVAERGYNRVTVRGLSRLAGVSTKSFYDCFANVEDCFVATYALIVRETLRFPGDLTAQPEDRLRARLRWFFTVLGTESKAASLILVDAPSTGPALTGRTRIANRALERFIATELATASNSTPVPRLLVHGATTAALQLARSQLLSARPASSAAAANEFADWLLALDGGGSSDLWDLETGTSSWRIDFPKSARIRAISDDRRFLIAAVTKIVIRDGYAKLTVPAICREAGVSRRAFDDCFRGVADCFLAAIEMRIAATLARAEAHAAAADSWERGIVRAIATICGEVKRDPAFARLAFVEILAPGAAGVALRERVLGRWARRLRRTAPRAIHPGQLWADASVAAAAAIVAATKRKRLDRAAPKAAFTILAPMIGSAAAEEAILAELRIQPRPAKSKNI